MKIQKKILPSLILILLASCSINHSTSKNNQSNNNSSDFSNSNSSYFSSSNSSYFSSSTNEEIDPSTLTHEYLELKYEEGYGITIIGLKKEVAEVIIPNEINNIPVISIGDSAFQWCLSLTSITIPNSITSIGSSAFYNCTKLTSIIIPDSVTLISESAFQWCTSLISITIPNSVISIGDSAFTNTRIWNNAANNSVVYADKWVVGYKGTIVEINLASDTKGIANYAFANCTSLISITIPNGVKSIGYLAFFNCTKVISITIPNSIISIDRRAFYDWESSQTIYIKVYSSKPNGWSSDWNYGCFAILVWNA